MLVTKSSQETKRLPYRITKHGFSECIILIPKYCSKKLNTMNDQKNYIKSSFPSDRINVYKSSCLCT